MSEYQVRDRRKTPFFMIDNHVLDTCARTVGVTAWAVYCVLCRWAINTTKPRVSVKQIAETLGVSIPTAKRGKAKLEKHYLIRSHKTQTVSIIELLEVTQLDFLPELLSREITSDPTEVKPERSPAIPPKDHRRSVREITNDPTSYKTVLKTVLKTPGSSRGIEHHPGSSRREFEKLKTELLELREKGRQLLGQKGARHKDVIAIGQQIEVQTTKLLNLKARLQA